MIRFFDRFQELCSRKGVSPNAVAKQIGISSGTVTNWKNGTEPRRTAVEKLAHYLGVQIEYMWGYETKEKAPTPEGEREIGFDDFTYAFNGEVKELTESDRQLLLSMARQLNEARKQRDGKKTD